MDGGHPAKGGGEDTDKIGSWKNFKNLYPESNNPHLPQKNLVSLSRDELRVLQECNRESFWYRSLPASMIFIGITQFAVNKGYLKPHPKLGATLKNIGAGLAGYILGKLSYQNECRKKILALPDSKLAETLRQRFSGGSKPTEFVPEIPPNTTNDPKYFEDVNVFDSKAEPKELPDPTFSLGDQSNDVQNQEYKSYEDLRRQNRKSYTENQYTRWTKQTTPPSPQPSTPPESKQIPDSIPIRESRSSNISGKSKNQYGDVWEEE